MTLAKCSASRILPTQPHASAFENERSKRDCFSKCPVDRRAAVAHLPTPGELAHHLRVHVKSFRHHSDLVSDTPDRFRRDPGCNDFRTIKLFHVLLRLLRLVSDLSLGILQCLFVTTHSLGN